MAQKPESRFRTWFVKELEKHYPGAYIQVNHGNVFVTRGRPDIEMLYENTFYGFELKMETGKATKLQKYHLDQIELNGGIGKVVFKGGTMPWTN